jgi:protein involved in polysaccharide export with SLBB domain
MRAEKRLIPPISSWGLKSMLRVFGFHCAAQARRCQFSTQIPVAFIILLLAGSIIAAETGPGFDAASIEKIGVDPTSISQQQIKAVLSAQSEKTTLPAGGETPEAENINLRKSLPAAPSAVSMSPIEQLLSGEIPGLVSGKLTQFGYDVFQRPVSTFSPVTNVPVGPDYVVGPGDGFTVTLWGRVNAQYAVEIDRNGQIALPEVGVLNVSGMTLKAMQDYLQDQLSRKQTDFKMAVTMGRLRSIKVFVVGEAQVPGSYTVSSLSTVINALFSAGGPSKNGSLRDIRLSRGKEKPIHIDLYNFLIGGDKSDDIRLQDGDTIFIPLIGPVVGVAGNVKRPAIYEMTKPMTLREALDLAGGVNYAGWLQQVQVERVENHKIRIVVDFNIVEPAGISDKQVADTIIRDGDLIKVFSVSPFEQNVVQLTGHVVRPGKYEWKQGMRLGDVISSYAVLQPQTNLEHAEIERLVEPDYHPIMIPFKPGKLLEGDFSQNIELARFDTIRIYRWDEKGKRSVSIAGEVYRPGEYRFVTGMKLIDLLDAAGGPQKNAYLKTAELTRRHVSQAGMQTETINVNLEKVLDKNPAENIQLKDYDHLIVRVIPELEFDRMATISGQVRFPGAYPITKGETLSSLIERAGGFTEEAYLRGAVFTRESAKVIQKQRLNELIDKVEESVLTLAGQGMSGALDEGTAKSREESLKAKKELLAKLRATKVDGRVVVKLAAIEQFRGSKYDLELEKGDSLFIPETPGIVSVLGEVYNPTSLLYQKDATVAYYLQKVGGPTGNADEKQISVIKADGSVVSIAQKNPDSVYWDSQAHQWNFGGFMGIRLNPGDTIVVPRKMDQFLWLQTTKDLTQILFQAALATGVILAL